MKAVLIGLVVFVGLFIVLPAFLELISFKITRGRMKAILELTAKEGKDEEEKEEK